MLGKGTEYLRSAVRAALGKKDTGLARRVSLTRFVDAAHDLEPEWPKLDKVKRGDRFGEAANVELKAAGVPEVGTVVKPLPGRTLGQFDFVPWDLDLDDAAFDEPTIDRESMSGMAETVFHESRHAEQWFRMAQVQAGQGKTAPELVGEMGIPQAVADSAVQAKLSGEGQDVEEGKAWQASVYGADAAHRQQVYADLDAHSTALDEKAVAYDTARSKLDAVQADPHRTQESLEAATKAVGEAWAAYQEACKTLKASYEKYRALPEEADAWAVGERTKGAY